VRFAGLSAVCGFEAEAVLHESSNKEGGGGGVISY
jgi:hypothetical protein